MPSAHAGLVVSVGETFFHCVSIVGRFKGNGECCCVYCDHWHRPISSLIRHDDKELTSTAHRYKKRYQGARVLTTASKVMQIYLRNSLTLAALSLIVVITREQALENVRRENGR